MNGDEQLLTRTQIEEGLKGIKTVDICNATGLSYPTVLNLQNGKQANYTTDTLIRVGQYIRNLK